jgi:hypothetical protein
MLTTPRAILIGLGLIAIAIVFQPTTRNAFITTAHAEIDGRDLRAFVSGPLESIARAINGIQACRG